MRTPAAVGALVALATTAALAGVGGLLGCHEPTGFQHSAWGQARELPGLISADPDEVVAVAISVLDHGSVTHIGVIYKSGGFDMKAAIYADAGGAPGQLIVATGVRAVVAGRQEIPLTLTYLPPGTYWVATVHNGDAGIGAGEGTTTLSLWAGNVFTNPFPATFPSSTPANGPDINYYLLGRTPVP